MAQRDEKSTTEKDDIQKDQDGPGRTGQQPEKRGQTGSASGKKSGSGKR